jgi:hypothetical protein
MHKTVLSRSIFCLSPDTMAESTTLDHDPLTANSVHDFQLSDSDDEVLSQIDENETNEMPISTPNSPLPPTPPPIDNPQPSRFVMLEEDDLANFQANQENVSTIRKTTAHMKLFFDFLDLKNEKRTVHTIPPSELDPLLGSFYVGVRKVDGQEYEPCYIKNIQGSIERHLKNRKYAKSITHDREFHASQQLLKAKQIDLRKQGKGNRPNKSDAIEDEDVDRLYESGALGDDNPESVLQTIWFNNTVLFGMRAGASEHVSMRWGDVELKQNSDGKEYLEKSVERQTKTRQGNDPRNIRESTPKAFARDDNRCPVKIYKKFRDNRPSDMMHKDAPFYLGTIANPKSGQLWFRRQRLGPDKLGKLMKKMKATAGLDPSKRITNTSCRKYLVQTLSDGNFAPTLIQQVTGHKSLPSINSYSKINRKQQECISNKLLAPTVPINNQICMSNPGPSSACNVNNPGPSQASALPSNYCHNVNMNKTSTTTRSSEQPCFNLFAGATITGGTIQVFMNPHPAKKQRIESEQYLSLSQHGSE